MRAILSTWCNAERIPRGLSTIARGTLVAVLACGGGGYGSSTSPLPTKPVVPTGPTDVTVLNNSFTPASLTVPVASTVTWTWDTCTGYGNGQTCVAHNVVFDDDGTTSGLLSQGSFKRKFTSAGTFAYHCSVHAPGMSGKVVVQ